MVREEGEEMLKSWPCLEVESERKKGPFRGGGCRAEQSQDPVGLGVHDEAFRICSQWSADPATECNLERIILVSLEITENKLTAFYDSFHNMWLGRCLSIGISIYLMKCLPLKLLEVVFVWKKNESLTNSYISRPIRTNLANPLFSYMGKFKTDQYSTYSPVVQHPNLLCYGNTDWEFWKATV